MLQEAAMVVVPSLRPDPAKEASKKRDAATRQLDKVSEAVAKDVEKYLLVEIASSADSTGTPTPHVAAAIRKVFLSGVLVGANNGPLSEAACKKLLRAYDTQKKQADEEALDRETTAKRRVRSSASRG
jgi:hypothetical protein